ncbi:MAG: flagellar biosynthesis protein FlhA, partial [Nitrospirota bacterium]
ILIVINFVVITKGAGRIAEVAARFTLDAMPGKQMSIDADLNAGLIDDSEARTRRKAIAREADFYGAMDGASKFVRGDAVAALVIVVVNIAGGLIIGIFQNGMDIVAAARNYTLLTIGEGLVAQLPALIISTAAGIIVSRAASESNLGTDITRQIFVHPKAVGITSFILFSLGLVPGLPHIAFLILGSVTGLVAYLTSSSAQKETEAKVEDNPAKQPVSEAIESLLALDLMELNIGYGLISLVDSEQGGELSERIRSIRKQCATEIGIIVPPIHIRDDLKLRPNSYSIIIRGSEIAKGELMPGHLLAMDPGNAEKGLKGIPTKEPCFGLPATWIPDAEKGRAQTSGYTVVDLSTIIATHLTEVIRSHAHEIIGRQEVQGLLDNMAKNHPKVVEELIPGILPLGGVVRVLQNLLRERVPVRDLRTILETLADYASMTKDTDMLTEYVRQALSRSITKLYQTPDGLLPLISLDPALDEKISSSIQQSNQGSYLSIEPGLAHRIIAAFKETVNKVNSKGYQPLLLTSPAIRGHMKRFIERFIPNLIVLSPNEISGHVKIQTIDTVRLADADQKV